MLEIVTFLFATKFSTFHSNSTKCNSTHSSINHTNGAHINTTTSNSTLFSCCGSCCCGGGGVAAVTFASGAVDVSTNDGVLLMWVCASAVTLNILSANWHLYKWTELYICKCVWWHYFNSLSFIWLDFLHRLSKKSKNKTVKYISFESGNLKKDKTLRVHLKIEKNWL